VNAQRSHGTARARIRVPLRGISLAPSCGVSAATRAAWANRAASAALVAGYLAAAAFAIPDAERRAALHYAVVTGFGYGHLLGAAKLPGSSALARACWALGVVNALLLYGLAIERWPALVLALLAVSVWHTVENDLALGAAYAAHHRLGPHPLRLAALAPCAAGTALVLALSAATLGPGEIAPILDGVPLAAAAHRALLALGMARRIHFGDVFAAATLHHLVSFALLLAARARALARRDRGAGERLALRAAACHAIPIALLAILPLAGPEAGAARSALLSPAHYLFVSVLHVLQTTARRGRGLR
jgi:hypothetical protein